MEKFLQNVQAMEAANETIMRQPLGSKSQAFLREATREFEEGLEVVCTFRGNYHQPAEYEYTPSAQDALDAFDEAAGTMAHHVYAMVQQLGAANLLKCEVLKALYDGDVLHEMFQNAMSDVRASKADTEKHMNGLKSRAA